MRNATTYEGWRQPTHDRVSPQAKKIAEILALADIKLNGPRGCDIQVHNPSFFNRVLADGSVGLGESYMDGWWDVPALDEFFARLRSAQLNKKVGGWYTTWLAVKSRLINLQTTSRSSEVAQKHYDLGNDLYEAMLDSRMQYTCAYWPLATTLDQAQRNKLDLICRKLKLESGMTILELGSGFGGFARYAAEEYGCHVVSYNISHEQIVYAREQCQGLPVRFEEQDYREAIKEEPVDRVVSIGLCEHIGYKNYRNFFELAHACLKPHGLFLLHTIGANESSTYTDPWIHKYIFPNGLIPSIEQLGQAMENLLVVEDWHNFGPDYDRTCMAWWENFNQAWPNLRERYGDRFYRMWKYYLMASAGSFRARVLQLWQIVLSKGDISSYVPVR